MQMTLVLVMVFQISVAMAIGFVLGRIWQIRCALEQELAGGSTAPPIAHELPRYNVPDMVAALREAVTEQLKKRSKLPELLSRKD
jgi:hypothetical protein